MTTESEFQAATAKAITNMDRLNQIVNGSATTTVTTDSGPVKSIAKLEADLYQQTVEGLAGASVSTILGLQSALDDIVDRRMLVTDAPFNAVGDGVTDDTAAFAAMAAATGGYINVPVGEFKVNLTLTGYTRIRIQGAGKPVVNNANSKLLGGTVIIGGIYAEAPYVYVADMGFDCGSGRSPAARGRGIWCQPAASSSGFSCIVHRVAALDIGGTGPHGITSQGYDYGEIIDCDAFLQQFGVVVKSRRHNIANIRGYGNTFTTVCLKGDQGAIAGYVNNGKVADINVSNVISESPSSDTTATAVTVLVSTDTVDRVTISGVKQTYGSDAVFVQGGGAVSDPTLAGVRISSVECQRTQYGVRFNGYTYDCSVTDLLAVNPASGKAVAMGTNTFNWSVTNVTVTISDSGITGTDCVELYGTGSFDNIQARIGSGTLRVKVAGNQLAQIATGRTGSYVTIENEGDLTGINGATLDSSVKARMDILPGSVLKLSGRFNLTGSTNKFFCNIPVNTGKQQVFACGGIDSSDNYVAVAVRLNDFQLSVEPSLPTGFKRIDLSGIQIALM